MVASRLLRMLILRRSNYHLCRSLNRCSLRYIANSPGFKQQADSTIETPTESNMSFSNTEAFANYKSSAEMLNNRDHENMETAPFARPFHNVQTTEHKLWMMDNDIRRFGRTDPSLMRDYLEIIEKKRSVTAPEVLTLINACGFHLPMLPCHERIEILGKFLKSMESAGFKFDISHYNCLLAAYLENFHDFSPLDFLAELEKNKIEPNRLTFQRLMKRFSQLGDLAGVSTILEYMKSLDLPVTEQICNILLYANVKAKNKDELDAVLCFMRENAIELTRESYFEMASAHAELDDLAAVEKVMHENSDVLFTDAQLLRLVYLFARNNNGTAAEEVLKRVRKSAGYLHEAMNVALGVNALAGSASSAVAVAVLATIHNESTSVHEEGQGYGGPILAQSIAMGMSDDQVVQLCQLMRQKRVNQRSIELAYIYAAEASKKSLAMRLMEQLVQEHGALLARRPQCFQPLMLMAAKENDLEGLRAAVELARRAQAQPDTQVLATFVWPQFAERRPVPQTGQEDVSLIDELRRALPADPDTRQAVAPAYLAYRMVQHDAVAVKRFLALDMPIYISPYLIQRMGFYWHATDDLTSCVTLLKRLADDPSFGMVTKSKLINEFVDEMLYFAKSNKIAPLINEFYKQKLGLPGRSFNHIQLTLQRVQTDVKMEQVEELRNLHEEQLRVSQSLGRDHHESSQIMDIDPANYEKYVAQRRSLSGLNNDVRQLLRQERLDDAMKLAQLIEASGNRVYTSVNFLLAKLALSTGRIDDAVQLLKKEFEKKNDQFIFDPNVLVEMLMTLLETNRTQDLFDIGRLWAEHCQANPDASATQSESVSRPTGDGSLAEAKKREFVNELSQRNVYLLENLLTGLFERVVAAPKVGAPKADAFSAVQFVQHLFDARILAQHHQTLRSTVRMLCDKKQPDLAKELLQTTMSRTKRMVEAVSVLRILVESNDVKRLQEVYNSMVEHLGESRATLRLAVALSLSGKLKEANKLVSMPSVNIGYFMLNKEISFGVQRADAAHLEAILNILQRSQHQLREEVFKQLLILYNKNYDRKAAMNLWARMQEENFIPSPEIQSLLSTMKITEMPEAEPEREKTKTPTASALLKLLNSQRVQTADVVEKDNTEVEEKSDAVATA